MSNSEDFYKAFLGALLWAEFDEDGNPLEDSYSLSDIDQCSANMIKELCNEFIECAGDDSISEHGYFQAGQDFYLTIAWHGYRFLDGDWPINGDKLDDICSCVCCFHTFFDEKIHIDVSIVGKDKSLVKSYKNSLTNYAE